MSLLPLRRARNSVPAFALGSSPH
jgi:hypothetical protein